MRTLTVVTLLVFMNAAFADAPELNATQNPNASYRLFSTHNVYNLLLLNTMDGSIRRLQWGNTFSRPLPKCPAAALLTGRPDGVAAASVEVAERMTGGAGG
jgi:hypothetical protein